MPRVHLIEGPVGAGKSTYSTALAQQTQGVHIALDEWFAALFSPDRPASDFIAWYMQRKERLLDLIWRHSRRVLASGADVMLELGLIQRQDRIEFCRRALDEGVDLTVYVLHAPLEVRRARVRRRNTEKGATFAMVVPDHVFELASQLWEAPDELECGEYRVTFVSTALDGNDDGWQTQRPVPARALLRRSRSWKLAEPGACGPTHRLPRPTVILSCETSGRSRASGSPQTAFHSCRQMR